MAIGYIWLVDLWLILANYLPKARPADGAISDLWELGAAAGATVVLAAVTFGAYMLGSLLEIDPQGSFGRRLVDVWWFTRLNQGLLLSLETKHDLLNYVRREYGRPAHDIEARVSSTRPMSMGLPADIQTSEFELVTNVSDEIPHIATRLQVSSVDLYGRYDRLMAEASLRINIAVPISIFFLVVTWRSEAALWLRLLATLLAVAVGLLLLRQGVARLIYARDDVVIQSLINIDGLRSRSVDDYGRQFHTPRGETS